jgi:PAS domain S-box-containing protein
VFVDRPGTALPPSDALLAAWFEQSHELLVVTDPDGRYRWANTRFREAFGIAGELLGNLMSLAAPGACGERTRAQLEAALRDGHLSDTDIELQAGSDRGDGSLWVRARMQAVQGHRLWTLLDIGEQRALAARTKELDELLEMVQDFGRLGVWHRDIASDAGRWDRRVFALMGFDESAGAPPLEQVAQRIHPEDREAVKARFQASRGHAGRHSHRYRVILPDGSVRRIHSQWQVGQASDGGRLRMRGTLVDDTEVYELARSLGDASAQLRLAVDLADIAIWRHDLASAHVHLNDRAYGVLGLPARPEGMRLEEVHALIHPDDRTEVVASGRLAMQTDRPVHLQARYRRADGTWRHVLMRRVVQRATDGTPLAFVGVGLDVTEQVLRQQENATLSQRLELAVSAAGLGIYTLEVDSDLADWNPQMFLLCGRAPGSVPPNRREWIDTVVHPDDRALAESARVPLLAGRCDQLNIEYRILRPDGEVRWQAHRLRLESLHDRPTLIGVVIDITDQRRAQQALREADERSALATRSAGIGIWEVLVDSGEARWDEQMFRLRGLAPAQRPPTREQRLALVHPDDRRLSIDAHIGALPSREPWRHEFRLLLPDGSVRWLASRSIAIEDDHGQVVRRLGVNWDITDAKDAEAARQQAAVAERASLAKSQFLSRMSHELRTPLNAVLGFSQLLQMKARGTGDADQIVKLGHIHSAGRHLLNLIDGVLDLSSMESGELPMQLMPVNLADVLQQAQPLLAELVARHGVHLVLGPLHEVVHADATRLLQVLVNLLSNGIKYNRPGGEVRVDAHRDGQSVVICVSDTGQGMSAEQLTHLFEAFNRLGAEHTGVEGTGIGLTIVKALVEGMGGTIAVRSRSGQGTSVELRLPGVATTPAAPPPDLPQRVPDCVDAATRQRSGRLLYIEDNIVNVMLVEELVRTLPGVSIVSEFTGTAGVRRVRELQPDLVLVDMQLPDFDGFEVLRRLRAQPETAAIPCIALSANAMTEDIDRALRSGFAEYWTKPIDFKHFLDSIDRWLPAGAITCRS